VGEKHLLAEIINTEEVALEVEVRGGLKLLTPKELGDLTSGK